MNDSEHAKASMFKQAIARIPKRHLAVLYGQCEHDDSEAGSRRCAKCAISLEINRLIGEEDLTPEHLLFVLARLAGEVIGCDAGGTPKHRMLADSLRNLTVLATTLVRAELDEEREAEKNAAKSRRFGWDVTR